MTVLTAAEIQQKHPNLKARTLREHARLGKIPHVRIGDRIFFIEDQFEEFLRAGGTGAPKKKEQKDGDLEASEA